MCRRAQGRAPHPSHLVLQQGTAAASTDSSQAGTTRDFPAEQLQGETGLLHPALEPFQGPSGVRSQDAEIGLKGQSWKSWNSPGRCRRQSCSRPWCSSSSALGVWLTQSQAGTVPAPSTLLEWELLPSLPSHFLSGPSSPLVSVSKVLCRAAGSKLPPHLMHKCCFPRAALCLMQPALPSPLVFCSPSAP